MSITARRLLRVPADRVLLALVVTMTIWAFNVSVVKWGLPQWRPLAYSADRFAAGSVLFAGYVLMREGSLAIARADLPRLALAAFAGIFANQVCFMLAIDHASAATVSLLLASAPALGALFAVVLGREHVRPLHWVGLAVSAVGVVLVILGSGGEIDLSSPIGLAASVGMAGSFAIYPAILRPLTTSYSLSRLSAVVLLVGTLPLVVVAAPQIVEQSYGAVTYGWAALAFSVLASLIVTNLLWYWAVGHGGSARATAMFNIQPFLGAFFGLALLGDHVSPEQWLGALVTVAGVTLTQQRLSTA